MEGGRKTNEDTMSTERYTTLNGSTKLCDFEKPGWTRVKESTRWNGNNRISLQTGSEWDHQRLNVRRHNGGILIVLEQWSQWQGSTNSNEELTIEQAKEWLAKNEDEGVDGFPELDLEVA